MLKGDGSWETIKLVLIWLVGMVTRTIQLPAHWYDLLHEILRVFAPASKRASIKIWNKLLRELCSMVLSIPGGLVVFSTLQYALSKITS